MTIRSYMDCSDGSRAPCELKMWSLHVNFVRGSTTHIWHLDKLQILSALSHFSIWIYWQAFRVEQSSFDSCINKFDMIWWKMHSFCQFLCGWNIEMFFPSNAMHVSVWLDDLSGRESQLGSWLLQTGKCWTCICIYVGTCIHGRCICIYLYVSKIVSVFLSVFVSISVAIWYLYLRLYISVSVFVSLLAPDRQRLLFLVLSKRSSFVIWV